MAVSKPSILRAHSLWKNIRRWGKNSPAYIVVHFTGGFKDNVAAMLGIYKSYAERGSNAHYLVGASAIWQLVDPKTYYCTYSCGSPVGKKNACLVPFWGPAEYQGPMSMSHAGIVGHSNSINVEICSCKAGNRRCRPTDDEWYFSDAAYGNAVELCAWLCDEFGIKVNNIVMHNQVTGKLCPAMWCNKPGAESGFEKFRMDVAYLLNDMQEDTPVSPNQEPEGGMLYVAQGALYYSRPYEDAPIVGQAPTSSTVNYTYKKDSFYYTENGWVLG